MTAPSTPTPPQPSPWRRPLSTVLASLWLLGVLLAAALPARAETSQVAPGGFTSSFREEIQASPEQAWAAISQLPRWWSSAHTWSGQASNMRLALEAGGCWCEHWGQGNAVEHGRVVLLQPGRVLRLLANLGPLQELPVQGVLTLVTSAQDNKTFLRLSYRVAGPPDAGLEAMAPLVDRVLGEQFRRLRRMAETGQPE